MADEADRAQAQIDNALEQALSRRVPTIQATGRCLSCDEPLTPGARFCDEDCSVDWHRFIQAQNRNGKGA